MQEEFLNVNETATQLRVHPNSVRAWLRLGALQGQKAGKKWLITQRAINALLEAQSAHHK